MSFFPLFLSIGLILVVIGYALATEDLKQIKPIKYELPSVIAKQVPDPSMGPFRPLLDILSDWNPDNPNQPESFREHLQYFDFGNPAELEMALAYRDAEVPFKLYNVSEFNLAAAKWSDAYLKDVFTRTRSTHVESSKNNHFMFWVSFCVLFTTECIYIYIDCVISVICCRAENV